MEITLCDDMYELIQNDFRLTEKEAVEGKGFGPKQLYTLEGIHTPLTIGP